MRLNAALIPLLKGSTKGRSGIENREVDEKETLK